MGPPQRPKSAGQYRPKSSPDGALEPATENQLAANHLYCLESIAGAMEAQHAEIFQTLANHQTRILHMVRMSLMPRDGASKQSSAQRNKRVYSWQPDGEAKISMQPASPGKLTVPKGHPQALKDMTEDNSSSSSSMHAKGSKARLPGQVDSDSDDSEEGSQNKVTIQLTDIKKKEGLLDMKKQVRDMFQSKGKPNDHYKDSGLAQKIVRHYVFENLVMIVISLNSLWIGVDAVFNHEDLLIDSDLIFIIMENAFCAFFAVELGLRFIAYESKCAAFKELWFVFDTVLVTFMVFEVWVMLTVIVVTGSNIRTFSPAVLRLVRILKFFRMARLVRLLRNVPEIMILLKGVAVAARPVFFSQVLLCAIVYIFAIAFFHLLKDTKVGNTYFPDLGTAMMTLLFRACFFNGLPDVAHALWDENFLLFFMLLLFIVVAPLTALNLIIGILVKVVETLENVESLESASVYLEDQITCLFQALDQNNDGMLDRSEFTSLMKSKQMIGALSECGLDVLSIAEHPEIIFNGEEEIPLKNFLSEILSLRSDNATTVRDMFLLKRMILQEIEEMMTQSTSLALGVRKKT